MPYKDLPIAFGGAGHKAAAVLRAICEGHDEIDRIAEATRLPVPTVIRVAALLRDLGHVAVERGAMPRFRAVGDRLAGGRQNIT